MTRELARHATGAALTMVAGLVVLLIIKTRASKFAGVRETILKLNTYELPEVLAYRVDDSSPSFAAWIRKATDRSKKEGAGKKKPARRKASAR